MEVPPGDTTIVVCQQSGIATYVIPDLVFLQLDSDTVTIQSPASNPRQDVETNKIRTWARH